MMGVDSPPCKRSSETTFRGGGWRWGRAGGDGSAVQELNSCGSVLRAVRLLSGELGHFTEAVEEMTVEDP